MRTVVRARRGRKLPVVRSPEETRTVLDAADGIGRVMLELLYGGGLRVGELVALRVETTMIYTHVPQSMAPDLRSPFDELW